LPSVVLVRHGPVALKASGLLSFYDFSRYIEAYELSGILPETSPPEKLARHARAATTVLASDAPRVMDTLARLGVDASVIDARFREAPPSAPRLPLSLPAIVWLALARARGEFDPGLAQARRDLRQRADQCARRLSDASEKGDVLLAGHGWFNRYVAHSLATSGWRKTGGPGFGRPWGYVVFDRGE